MPDAPVKQDEAQNRDDLHLFQFRSTAPVQQSLEWSDGMEGEKGGGGDRGRGKGEKDRGKKGGIGRGEKRRTESLGDWGLVSCDTN